MQGFWLLIGVQVVVQAKEAIPHWISSLIPSNLSLGIFYPETVFSFITHYIHYQDKINMDLEISKRIFIKKADKSSKEAIQVDKSFYETMTWKQHQFSFSV